MQSEDLGVRRATTAMRRAALAVLLAAFVALVTARASALPVLPAADCRSEVGRAVALARGGSLEDAAAALTDITRRCPDQPAAWRELAAVRFRLRLWGASAAAAERAVALDPDDRDAWQLLGADRFLLHESERALDAWNVIGAPRIDDIQVSGATGSRRETVAASLGMNTGDLLTASSLRRARRRLELMPAVDAVRVAYQPTASGEADLEIALVESGRMRPSRAGAAFTAAIRAGLERTMSIAAPAPGGVTGRAAYRWETHRPRVALNIGKAVPSPWAANVELELAAETQTYAVRGGPVEEKIREGVVTLRSAGADWLSAAAAGFHRLAGRADFLSGGVSAERRSADDRGRARLAIDAWVPLRAGVPIATRLAFSAALQRPIGALADVDMRIGWGGIVHGTRAPRALWPGAGTGRGRPGLLRAHPLLEDGIVAGPAFAPSLATAGAELTRWFGAAAGLLGASAFVDGAGVTFGAAPAGGRGPAAGASIFADAGAGLRVRAPGHAGRLRLDFALGLTDRARAVSIAWEPAR